MLKKIATLTVVLTLFSACTKSSNSNEKVLYVVSEALIKGLNPHNTGDTYSSVEATRVYEGLLQFHYLKRPYELEPNLATAMPKVSDGGKTYTFTLKKGILFHDNKCFEGGVGREMKAADVVYSMKHMANPVETYQGFWLVDGKLKGLNEWRKKNSGKKFSEVNWDEKVEGVQALDDYTVQFKLNNPSPQFLYALAMSYTFVIARECREYYGQEFLNNPVGTGPYMTGTYTRGSKIVYTKHPKYRDEYYPTEGAPGDKEKGFLKDAGKKIPFADKVVVSIQPESQPRWLNFEKGKLDYTVVDKDNMAGSITPDKGLIDRYTKKGILLDVTPDLDVTFTAFNFDVPLLRDNPKLRQAMSMAYNIDKSIELFYPNGRAIKANGPVPPGIGGYDESFKNPYTEYNLEKAKKLLAEAGFPNGKGLPQITLDLNNTTVYRQMAEYFRKQMAKIGVQIKVIHNTWPQLTQKVKKRQVMLYSMAWLGDYPDAENFLQLFYGKNISPGPNGANYDMPWFNKAFEKYTQMQPGPERTKKYVELNQKIAKEVPWILGVHRTSFEVKHGWLKNYKYSTFNYGNVKYWDVDVAARNEQRKKL